MAVKGRPLVDREVCKGCLLCVRACPRAVLAVDESPNSWGYYPVRVVNEGACVACGNCYAVCPDVAISIYKL